MSGKIKNEMIWANLLHLSYNMWADWDVTKLNDFCKRRYICPKPYLRFNTRLWDELLRKMVDIISH